MYNNSTFSKGFNDFRSNSKGIFQVEVFTENRGKPIKDAKIFIYNKDEPDKIIDQLSSDESGQSQIIQLPAPPIEYSLSPDEPKPYQEYGMTVQAKGYKDIVIEGIQVFGDDIALQPVDMNESDSLNLPDIPLNPNNINIEEHTLWGDFPPKIPESEIKELPKPSGFVVLDKPVIPEYVVVHTGKPGSPAKDYWIPFKDYIKNVASSEIYSTWPYETIKANVLAIISFTMNRVFTEWYRGKGYSFTVTNSTAYDQSFSYGRTIYKTISTAVDEIFNYYITRPGANQPILTQYCDGKNVQCNGLSQWGSKALGDKGLNAINILKNYYGSDIYLVLANKVSGVPSSYPGAPLQKGSVGKDVRTIQTQLNAISNNYPAIIKTKVDGIFGEKTRQQVETFQKIFRLPASGIVDSATWYSISNIYVAVTKMA